MNRALISSLLAAGLLAGCGTLEPTYNRPAAPVPAAFPQGGVYPAAQAAPTAPSEVSWKALFADPKLQVLIETALVQNRDLRATVANVAAARAQFQVQRSQLLPNVGAGVSFTRTRLPGKVDSRVAEADLGLSSYEIDLFGRLRSLSKAAFEQYLASDEGRRGAQLSLVAATADAYLVLATDRSLVAVSRQTQRSGEEALALTQRRLDIGVASQLDVSQAQTVVEQARANAAAYEVSAAQAKNALDLLVGSTVPEAQTPASLEEVAPNFKAIPAGLSSAVLLNRPDVLQAEHQLLSANAEIGAARAAFFPSITLTGQAGVASTSLSGLFNGPDSVWTFAPAINLPLFTGGRNRANLRLSKAQRDAAVATYESTVQGAFRDVADALAAQGGVVPQLQAQTALVAASDDALKLSTARYQRGVDTYLSTLDAQRTLYGAQQNLVNVQYAQVSNLVTLYRVLGGGL